MRESKERRVRKRGKGVVGRVRGEETSERKRRKHEGVCLREREREREREVNEWVLVSVCAPAV